MIISSPKPLVDIIWLAATNVNLMLTMGIDEPSSIMEKSEMPEGVDLELVRNYVYSFLYLRGWRFFSVTIHKGGLLVEKEEHFEYQNVFLNYQSLVEFVSWVAAGLNGSREGSTIISLKYTGKMMEYEGMLEYLRALYLFAHWSDVDWDSEEGNLTFYYFKCP